MKTSALQTSLSSLVLVSAIGCGSTAGPATSGAPPTDGPIGVDTTVAAETANPPPTVTPTASATVAPITSATPATTSPLAVTVDACRATIDTIGGSSSDIRAFECPAGCAESSSWLWGDGVYTGDSYLCVAATHAGAIQAGGGKAFVEVLPGQPSYPMATRNGVESHSWGSYPSSFRILARGSDGKPSKINLGPAPKPTTTCETPARAVVSSTFPTAVVTCPSGCASAWVYGSGPYTDDSSVCSAAIHAGIIGAQGGDIRVALGAAMSKHQASTKNGVTTRAWSGEYVTFSVSRP